MKKIVLIIAISVALLSIFAFSSLAAVESVDGWNSYTTADYLEVRGLNTIYFSDENVRIPFTFNSSSIGSIEAPHFEVLLNMGISGWIDVPAGYTVQIQMDYFCGSTSALPLSTQYIRSEYHPDNDFGTEIYGTVELSENGYDYVGKISWQNNTGIAQQVASFYCGMKPTTAYNGMYSFNLYGLKYRVLSPEQAAQDVYLNWTPEPQLPEGSEIVDDLNEAENELFDDADLNEWLAKYENLAADGSLLMEAYAGEFAVVSLLFSDIFDAVPDFAMILYISLLLGAFGLLTGVGHHLIQSRRESVTAPEAGTGQKSQRSESVKKPWIRRGKGGRNKRV